MNQNFYIFLLKKMTCSTVQFLVQIAISPTDMETSCHSICFLTDYLCKISFSKNQEKSHALLSEIQSLKVHWLYQHVFCLLTHKEQSMPSACKESNHLSKYHSKCSIVVSYQAKLLSNAGMLGKGRKSIPQVLLSWKASLMLN